MQKQTCGAPKIWHVYVPNDAGYLKNARARLSKLESFSQETTLKNPSFLEISDLLCGGSTDIFRTAHCNKSALTEMPHPMLSIGGFYCHAIKK